MTITVTDTTKNSGGAATAVASTTSFYLSVNNTLSPGDVLLGSRSVGILAPNGTSAASTTLPIPTATAPGSYYILAIADDGNAVAESNETNNTKSAQIKLSPDLLVSSLSVPTKAAPGGTFSATDTTKNQGQGTAGATTTRFYLSPTSTFNPATATELGSRAVALLASGASGSGSTSLTIPAGTATGSYYILARADADGAVAETNETNNVLSKAMTVSP
jgi:subtilase family serine protease